jgi:hypothetical protein
MAIKKEFWHLIFPILLGALAIYIAFSDNLRMPTRSGVLEVDAPFTLLVAAFPASLALIGFLDFFLKEKFYKLNVALFCGGIACFLVAPFL